MATVTSSLPIPGGRNLIDDPWLDTLELNPRGAVVDDTHPTSGGPNGGRYLRRRMVTANTSSPQNAIITGTGTNGVPMSPGQPLTPSIYARKNPGSGPSFRFDVSWIDSGGATLSTSNGSGFSPSSSWNRHEQTFVAPASTAYATVAVVWTGIAVVEQLLDLAMVQVEKDDAASEWTDNRTMRPVAVLNYATRRQSRSIVHEPLGSKYPTVFLREAQSKSGTLSLLFVGDAVSREAEDFLGQAARFAFTEPEVGEAWDFVVTGAVTRTRQTGTSYWTVDAEVREVAP